MTLRELVVSLLVGVVVYLVSLLLLGALGLPTSPWSALLGLLAALSTYLGSHR